ncbi:MAG: DUF721 domain-containing protein [Rikenellaceae bacterium]
MKQTEPLMLGELLTEFFEQRQLAQGCAEGRAKDVWRDVAGDYVSSMTEDVFLRGGTIYIKVVSASVRSEIHIRRRYYIERLNSSLGRGVVRGLVIR